MLSILDLHFAYPEKQLLKGISFSMHPGEIVALIGMSGSGKTTLFRLITGLLPPLQGEILINGVPRAGSTATLTYMRQEDLLLPWRNCLQNLLLFTELGSKTQKKGEAEQKALALLAEVGLEGFGQLFPRELSGGMRQRVSLARALLQNRPLLLLDEPFASLDIIHREQLYSLLRRIRDQDGKTILMVTHDFRDALALADRILVLGVGKIVADIPCKKEPKESIEAQIRLALTQSLG